VLRINEGFYRYVSQKRKVKGSVLPLVNKNGKLLSTDEEKAEVPNKFFASVFNGNLSSRHPQVNRLRDGEQGGKGPPIVREDQACDQLKNVKVQKCVGPEGMHPRVLRNWLM